MGRRIRIILQCLLVLAGALLFMGCPEQFDQANLKNDIKDEVDYATAQKYELEIVVPANSIFSGPTKITIKEGYFTDINITPMSGYGFLGWEQTGGSGTITFENDDPNQASTKVTISGGNVTLTPSIDARPTIHYFTPFGTDIPLNAQFNVVMSEAIDPTTLSDATIYIQELTSGEKVDGLIRYENGVIKLQPTENLKPFMPYTIYLSEEITDTQGLSLGTSISTDQFRSGKEIDEGGADPPEVVVDPFLGTRTYMHPTLAKDVTVYYTNSTNIDLLSVKATDTNGPAGAIKVEVPTGNGTEVLTNYYQYKEFGQPLSFSISDVPGAHVVKLYTLDPAGNELKADGVTPIDATELVFIYENEYNAFQGGLSHSGAVDVSDTGLVNGGNHYYKTSNFNFTVNPETRTLDQWTMWVENIQDPSETYLASMPASYRISTSGDMSTGEWSEADNAYAAASSWNTLDSDAIHSNLVAILGTGSYATTFDIGPGEGQRSVYVQFKNETGQESLPSEYTLIHQDNQAPTVTAGFKNTADYVNTLNVDLLINIHDTGSENSSYSITGVTNTITDQVYDPLNPEVSVELPGGDGLKTIQISANDGLGNTTTESTNLTITLDQTAPTAGTIILAARDGNESETASSEITVNCSGLTDALSGVDQIGLRNSTSSETVWYPAATSYDWTLSGKNGTKTVVMSLKDKAGNVSTDIASDSIMLNIPPPENSFTINNGATLTNNPKLNLLLAYSTAEPMFKCWEEGTPEPTLWTFMDPGTKQADIQLTVSVGDGIKTVNVVYADQKDVSNQLTIQKSITLDTTAPGLSALSVKGKEATVIGYTKTNIVAINADVNSAAGFRIGINNGTTTEYTGWQKMDEAASTLEVAEFKIPEDTLSVILQITDKAGNIATDSRSITIDQKLPTIGVALKDKDLTNEYKYKLTNSTDITAEVSFSDNITAPSNAMSMRFSNDGKNWSSWAAAAATADWSLPAAAVDGEYKVYYQLRDAAGNYSSTTAFATIVLDTEAPKIEKFLLNGGEAYTPALRPKISLTAGDKHGLDRVYEVSGSVESNYSYTAPEFQAKASIDQPENPGLKEYTLWVSDNAGNLSDKVTASINYVEPAIIEVTKGDSKSINAVFKPLDGFKWAEGVTYNIYYSTSSIISKADKYISVGYTSSGVGVIDDITPATLYYVWIQAVHGDSGGFGRRIFMGTGYKSDITIISQTGNKIPSAASEQMTKILTSADGKVLNEQLSTGEHGETLRYSGQMPGTPYSVMILNIDDIPPEYTENNMLDAKIVLFAPLIKTGRYLPDQLLNIINEKKTTLFMTFGLTGMAVLNEIEKVANDTTLIEGPEALADEFPKVELFPLKSVHHTILAEQLRAYNYGQIEDPRFTLSLGKDINVCFSNDNEVEKMTLVPLKITMIAGHEFPLLALNGRYAHLAIDGTNDSVIIGHMLNLIGLTIKRSTPFAPGPISLKGF